MPRFRYAVFACALTLASGLLVAGSPAATAADPPPYSVTENLHFKVQVGPNNEPCDIVGDLYVPAGASSANRMPAILSTNGFGGNKDDQDALSAYAASRGYVALTYSGLGFGGSSCKITLDDPAYDGRAASQLIDYLGGKKGIAYKNKAHTQPAPVLASVKRDPGAANDPRVGMVGGSYGGQVQYAAASVTKKLDTIVPIITWNDLSYSLGPNNTDQKKLDGQEQVGVSTETPGVVKQNWALGFSALGLTADVPNQQAEVPAPCPNFADFVCPALVTGAGTGALSPAAVSALRKASVATYQDKVKIPTLLLQGQADTLFNLNEAAATYEALQAQGTDVKMSWIEFGHSGPAAEGELDIGSPDSSKQLITRRIFNWFGHYLKRDGSPTGPEFSYFRDWVNYSGIATKAYASSTRFPVGSSSTYHLSNAATPGAVGKLVTQRSDVESNEQSFVAPVGPVGSTAEDPDVVDGFFQVPEDAERDAPGTFASYDTEELSDSVDVVGSPTVKLKVKAQSAAATQGADAGKLVLFLKVIDIDGNENESVVRNLAAPVRVPDVEDAITVTMPAFVHRFESGHKIRLVVAGASPNYRGNNVAVPVSIATGDGGAPTALAAEDQALQSITLPIVAAADQAPYVPGPDVPQSKPGQGNGDDGDGDGSSPGAGNNGNGNANWNGQGNGSAGGQDAAQAAPVAADASTASSLLPDTGGPPLGLLGAGLLLIALGAHLLMRRRRDSFS